MQYSVETFRRKSPWLQGVREKMRAQRLSPRTEDAYCHWIVDLVAWSGWMNPAEITSQQVTDYLSFLAVTRKVSASTQNQAFNAILFLFRRVLEKEMGEVKAERAKVSANVPEFVTADEFKQVVRHLTGDYRTLALLAFGTGLRLMELLRLRVKDVEFGAGLLIVRDGKGGKDRVVPLPKSLRDSLRVKIVAVSAMHAEDLAGGFGSVWLPDALAGAPGSATVGELEKIEALLDAAGIDDHHGGGGDSYYRYSTAYRVENALAYKKMFEESEQYSERLNGAIRYLLSRWKR